VFFKDRIWRSLNLEYPPALPLGSREIESCSQKRRSQTPGQFDPVGKIWEVQHETSHQKPVGIMLGVQSNVESMLNPLKHAATV